MPRASRHTSEDGLIARRHPKPPPTTPRHFPEPAAAIVAGERYRVAGFVVTAIERQGIRWRVRADDGRELVVPGDSLFPIIEKTIAIGGSPARAHLSGRSDPERLTRWRG